MIDGLKGCSDSKSNIQTRWQAILGVIRVYVLFIRPPQDSKVTGINEAFRLFEGQPSVASTLELVTQVDILQAKVITFNDCSCGIPIKRISGA